MSEPPRHAEVWWCDLGEIGVRPVVVLTRDATIPRLRRVMIAPCTTTERGLDTEVVLDSDQDPVQRRSVVNLDSVESVGLGVFVERLGTLSALRMAEVCRALAVAVDC